MGCPGEETPEDNVTINSFTASMTTVAMGGTVSLSWNVSNATSIRIVASPGGELTSSMDATGMVTSAAINADTTFTLTADGMGGPATRSVMVTVQTVNPNAPTITSFTATPPMVAAGGSTTLAWTTQNATQVRILNGASELFNTEDMLNSGSFQTTVDANTTFTLEASNNDGMATDTVSVTVVQAMNENEPNDDPTMDTLDNLGPGGIINGSIDPVDDLDFFLVEVTEGQNISVFVTDADGTGCTVPSVTAIFAPGADPSMEPPIAFNDDRAMGQTCSTIDPTQIAAAGDLSAGTYLIGVGAEAPDSPTFDYRLTVTVGNPGCGNDITEVSQAEQCDDGNTTPGDGCSATCTAEPVGTVNGLNQDQTFADAIDVGQEDFFEVILDADGYILSETGIPTIGMCEADGGDTVLAVYDSTFVVIASNDDTGGTRCSRVAPRTGADILTAGTYYVGVSAFAATGTVAAYEVRIQTIGVGCSNGIVEAGETCDDGNTTPGDGCSATCTVEPVGTVNGLNQDQTFADAIDVGQEDVIEVILDADGYIVAETGIPTIGMCEADGGDTVLAVYDSAFMELAFNDDTGGTRCSRVAPLTGADLLTAGTYYVGVAAFSATGTVAAYEVRIQTLGVACGNGIVEAGETCDDGNAAAGDGCDAMCNFEGTIVNEVEANNDIMNANDSTATVGNTVYVQGIIDPAGDVDVFSFTVPMGQTATLVASTATALDGVTCSEDTLLRLTDDQGMELTSNDDIDLVGGNFCSLIDGNVDAAAAGLTAGTYYIEVHHFDDTEAFIDDYFLNITLQ